MLYIVKDLASSVEEIIVEANCAGQAEDFGYYYFASSRVKAFLLDGEAPEGCKKYLA